MPYSFIDEDDSKFTLSNGDGEFSIAKYGLDDGFMEKLRSLPRAYADGGMVEPMQIPLDPLAQEAMPRTFAEPSPMAPIAMPPPELTAPIEMAAPTAPLAAPPPPQMTAPNMTPKELVGPPRELMPSTVGTPTMPGYYEEAQKLAQPEQAGSFALPSDMADAFRRMQQASSMDAQAKSDAALQQAAAMEEAAKDIQLEQVRYETKLRGIEQEREGLLKDYASGKIDPTRIYTNMSTGNRVMAGISVLLGSLSQGLTGAKSNPAMDVINNAIDRDIDAQKAELGKKQNLLAFNMQKYGNLKDAMNATKMQIMTLAQAQVNAAASKAGSKQALAAANMFNADIDLKMASMKQQLAASAAMAEKLNDPKGLSPQDVHKLNQDIQDKLVILPNGNFIPALNKESATAVKTAQKLYFPIKDLTQRFRTEMAKGWVFPQGLIPDVLQSEQQIKAKALETQMLFAIKNLEEMGALTEGEVEVVKPLIPEVGKIINPGAQKKAVDLIDSVIDSKLNAVYSANVPGLNPSGRAQRSRSAFGGK